MNSQKTIEVGGDSVTKEDLPMPYVSYPGMYSAYFAFQETKKSPYFFCSCAKESIENHIKLQIEFVKPTYISSPDQFFALKKQDFPESVYKDLRKQDLPNSSDIIDHLLFENRLCHECNKKVPEYRYCHEIYGGAFKQNYGWYIQKQFFEFGIMPLSYQYIKELTPFELLNLMKIDSNKYYEYWIRCKSGESEYKLNKYLNDLIVSSFGEKSLPDKDRDWHLARAYEKQKRRIHKLIENIVRDKFGFKKVGEAWTSETILYYIIKSIYPNRIIHRHYRPDFLEGLELDIYIEELKLGIEYQGIQHFKPVNYWGGKEAFEKLKIRDKKKKQICDGLGISLLYFNYDENLSEDYILHKIQTE